jgi:hypothetical protein
MDAEFQVVDGPAQFLQAQDMGVEIARMLELVAGPVRFAPPMPLPRRTSSPVRRAPARA